MADSYLQWESQHLEDGQYIKMSPSSLRFHVEYKTIMLREVSENLVTSSTMVVFSHILLLCDVLDTNGTCLYIDRQISNENIHYKRIHAMRSGGILRGLLYTYSPLTSVKLIFVWKILTSCSFCQHALTSILTWMSNHMSSQVWDEITYAFQTIIVCTFDVWE